jgi:hypothetical protein
MPSNNYQRNQDEENDMNRAIANKKSLRRKDTSIRTNIMEILAAISSRTNDDHAVIAAVKNIFKSNRVRLANSLVPLRLVEVKAPAATKTGRNPKWAR